MGWPWGAEENAWVKRTSRDDDDNVEMIGR